MFVVFFRRRQAPTHTMRDALKHHPNLRLYLRLAAESGKISGDGDWEQLRLLKYCIRRPADLDDVLEHHASYLLNLFFATDDDEGRSLLPLHQVS